MFSSRALPGYDDSQRDALRYHRLLLALQSATSEIRNVGAEGSPAIDALLGRLLPDLMLSVDASKAFVALVRPAREAAPGAPAWDLEVSASYPDRSLTGRLLSPTPALRSVVEEVTALVVDRLTVGPADLIPGLEPFGATSTVLVRLQTPDQVRVVGVCNKRDPGQGPYLAEDRMAFESVVELIAAGARVAIQNTQLRLGAQLDALDRIALDIAGRLDTKGLLRALVERAADLLQGTGGGVYLWDAGEQLFRLEAAHGLQEAEEGARFARGHGIITRVFETRAPYAINDYRSWNERHRQLDRYNLTAVVGAPILSGERFLGVIVVHDTRAGRNFGSGGEELLLRFARHAAVALTNAEAYAAERRVLGERVRMQELAERRVKQLEHLRSVGQEMTRSATDAPKVVLDRIARCACDVLAADCAVIYPYELDQDIYDVRNIGAHNLINTRQFKARLGPLSHSMTSLVLASRHRLIVDDVSLGTDRSCEVPLQSGEGRFLYREAIRSFAGIRLEAGDDESLGALFVNFRRLHTLGDDELETLEIFGTYAAMAIQQARLFQRGEKHRRAVRASQEVSRQIGAGSPQTAIVRSILYGALDVTGAPRGAVLEWNAARGEFVTPVKLGRWDDETCGAGAIGACPLLREVRERGEARLIHDLAEDPAASACGLHCPGVGSFLAVPQADGDGRPARWLILLESPDRAAFNRDDRDLVTGLTLYANIASQNAERYREIEDNARLLRGLLQAGQEIATLDATEQVLKWIADSVTDALHCDVVTLYTYRQKDAEIGFPAIVQGRLEEPGGMRKLQYVTRESVVGKLLESGEPCYADDAQNHGLMSAGEFARRERICSSAGIPLRVGAETVGILFVNYRTPHPFAPQQRNAIEMFAIQAAIAIHNARLYDRENKRTAQLEALYEASRVLVTTAGLEREKILDAILKQAVESITGAVGRKARLGTIQLYNAETNELQFSNVYPPDYFPELAAKIGQYVSLDSARTAGSRIGVTGRAVLERRPQLVPDVTQFADYVEYNAVTQSELAVPLLDGQHVLGVLNVESEYRATFDEQDAEALSALADLAVVAINSSEQSRQLGRSNTIALMGAWGADIVHDVKREVGAIRRSAFLLVQRPDLHAEARERLAMIDSSAESLALPALPARPLRAGAPVEIRDAPVLDEVVTRVLQRFKEKHPAITCTLECGCDGLKAGMDAQWLQRLLRHLLNNAVRVLEGWKGEPQVILRTARKGPLLEVQVQDSGPGVPPEIRPLLFEKPIPREGGEGLGLLLVRFLAEQHGGEARLLWSLPGQGTCFVLRIPIVVDPGAGAQSTG